MVRLQDRHKHEFVDSRREAQTRTCLYMGGQGVHMYLVCKLKLLLKSLFATLPFAFACVVIVTVLVLALLSVRAYVHTYIG
jgi:hypothetical protein